MLAELGRTQEGVQKRLIGEQNLETFEQFPEIALLYFWLDEKEGSRLTRRTLPHPSAHMLTTESNFEPKVSETHPSNPARVVNRTGTITGTGLLKD